MVIINKLHRHISNFLTVKLRAWSWISSTPSVVEVRLQIRLMILARTNASNGRFSVDDLELQYTDVDNVYLNAPFTEKFHMW